MNAGQSPRVVSVHDETPLLILWDAARIQGFDREDPVSELRDVMRRAKEPESPSWCFQGAPRQMLELGAAFGTMALCPQPDISSVVLQLNLDLFGARLPVPEAPGSCSTKSPNKPLVNFRN